MKNLTKEEMLEISGGYGEGQLMAEIARKWAEAHEREAARGDHKYEGPSETGSDKHTEM